MSERFDFHTHTHVSDGSLSPTELVRAAAANGVTGFALTDHDTVAGIAEAQAEANRLGIELIPGIEISVNESDGARSLHVLGLGLAMLAAVLAMATALWWCFERNTPKIRGAVSALLVTRPGR